MVCEVPVIVSRKARPLLSGHLECKKRKKDKAVEE